MKIKSGFVLRQVADTWVVMPLGQKSLDFDGILTLNETGALLWQVLEKGGSREDMADALTGEYDVSREVALADAEVFLEKLRQADCVE